MSITHNTVQCLKLSHVCSWKAIRDTNFLYIFEKILFAVCVWNYTLILSASAFQSPWNSMKYPWKVLEFFMWILLLTMICVHVTQAQILPTSSKHVSLGMRFLGLGIGGLSHQSCMSLHIGTNNIVGGSKSAVKGPERWRSPLSPLIDIFLKTSKHSEFFFYIRAVGRLSRMYL